MMKPTDRQAIQLLDASILSYIVRLRSGLTAEQVLDKVRKRFRDHSSWGLERITELLDIRLAARVPKPIHNDITKAGDIEVKGFIRSFAPSGEKAKAVQSAVESRFGADRTPSLTTISQLLAKERRLAGLPPKRARYRSRDT